jgi:DNA-binding response OmpR family regulator
LYLTLSIGSSSTLKQTKKERDMEKSLKIILVDDNTDYLFTMETFLQRNGFEVHTADDGQKGLDLIRKENPDIVLLDVMMESLFSGFELCKKIRTEDDLKHIPIIGISGMGDELGINYKQWPDFEYFSPDAFLDKPVDKQRLLKLIPATIEKAKKRKKRPKWKEKMDNDWAKKASTSQ